MSDSMDSHTQKRLFAVERLSAAAKTTTLAVWLLYIGRDAIELRASYVHPSANPRRFSFADKVLHLGSNEQMAVNDIWS